MNHEEKALTGIIDCSSMVFYEQNYQFTFMPAALQEGVVTLSSQGSYILGATHFRKRIAIYTGDKCLPGAVKKPQDTAKALGKCFRGPFAVVK